MLEFHFRWPAIVCKDPVLPHHVWCDVDGDPLSYHVEYLGDTHSHGWVDNRFILLYGEKSTDTEQENKSHVRLLLVVSKILGI